MKCYYNKCFDPIQKDVVYYYILMNRLRRHRDLYKDIKIGNCVIKGDN